MEHSHFGVYISENTALEAKSVVRNGFRFILFFTCFTFGHRGKPLHVVRPNIWREIQYVLLVMLYDTRASFPKRNCCFDKVMFAWKYMRFGAWWSWWSNPSLITDTVFAGLLTFSRPRVRSVDTCVLNGALAEGLLSMHISLAYISVAPQSHK